MILCNPRSFVASLPLVSLQVGEEGDEEGFEDNDLDLEEFEVRALLRQIWLGKSHPLESRV